MQAIVEYLKKPYREKGIFIGTLDVLLRLVTAFLWIYLLTVLVRLVWSSLLLDYDPRSKMWWMSYSFLIFFGASWIAYIICFVRDYYEE